MQAEVGFIEEAKPRTSEVRRKIEQAVKQHYMQPASNEDGRTLEGIQKFLATAQVPPVTIDRVIHEAALAINRIFAFKEVAIGLKSPVDGRYRYEEIIGQSKSSEQALRKLSYDLDEFFSQADYPSIRLSKVTELCVVEEQPFPDSERNTYNRPSLLSGTRNSPDEFVEGDYIDIAMYTPEDEMIGWVELGMPMYAKMPSIPTIKRLEVFASVLSLLIQNALTTKK